MAPKATKSSSEPQTDRKWIAGWCPFRDIGNRTFRRHGLHFSARRGRRGDAMEGEFWDGRTDAVCDPAQGWGDDGWAVPGVRHLAQDRLQDLRYEQCGMEGLSDRTRRPFRYANQLPESVEVAIVRAKREKPHWGARKIRERLLRRLPHAIRIPAASTIHAVLDH